MRSTRYIGAHWMRVDISFFRSFFETQNDVELIKKSTNPDFLHVAHFSLLRLADNKLESYNNI